MEIYKTDRGSVEFFAFHGRVIDSDKVSETHVSSSGGDVWTDANGNAHSTPLTVSSTSVTNHDFWIMTDDGKEQNIKLIGHDVPLRVGQRITVLYAQIEGGETGWPAAIINHNAKKHWYLYSGKKLNKYIDFFPATLFEMLLYNELTICVSLFGVIFGIIFMIAGQAGSSYLILGALIHLTLGWRRVSRREKAEAGLDAHIGELCQSIYQTHGDNPEVSMNQGQIPEAS